MTAADRLDEIRARYVEWHSDRGDGTSAPDDWPDADWGESMDHYIVRNDVPGMHAALRAVLDLHKRGPRCRCCAGYREDGTRIERWACAECPPGSPHYVHWPCPTVRAVEAALGVAS